MNDETKLFVYCEAKLRLLRVKERLESELSEVQTAIDYLMKVLRTEETK